MKLLNSAVMTREGVYTCKDITFKQFKDKLKFHYNNKSLETFIGYQQNIDLIKKWVGIKLPINRVVCKLNEKDEMLVMKLNYRMMGQKGTLVNENNFIFQVVSFSKLD